MSSDKPTIQRILVPHDTSETAQRALDYAIELATPVRARVTILHAYEVLAYGFPEAPAMRTDRSEIDKAAQQAFAPIVERARRSGVEVDFVLRHGPTWSEINDAAKAMKADLIVMGTHGRRGFARALLGSVAEKVVRTASCPVLTVRATATDD